MKCPNCGQETKDAGGCGRCSTALTPSEDPAVRLAQYAEMLTFMGIITCGIAAVIAIPVAVWAVISGRRSGVRPFGMAETIVLVTVGAFSLVIGAAALPSILRLRDAMVHKDIQVECLTNLRGISLAARLYAEDHDGQAPPTAQWTEALRPYTNAPVFQCPAADPGSGGYVYNSGAAGARWEALPNAAELVAFFDGPPGRDVVGGVTSVVPRHAIPPHAAVFAFADGHTEAATPKEARAFRWNAARQNPALIEPGIPAGHKPRDTKR